MGNFQSQTQQPIQEEAQNKYIFHEITRGGYMTSCFKKTTLEGQIKKNLIISIISLILAIGSIITSFNFVPEYKELVNVLLLKLEEENKLNDKYKRKFDIKGFWCDLKLVQNTILITYFIIIVLLFVFFIIQKIYSKVIIEKEKKQGKITTIMIIVNFIFSFFIKIGVAIYFYLFIYEFIIILIPPLTFQKAINYSNGEYISEKSEEEKKFDKLYWPCLIYGLINVLIVFVKLIFMSVLGIIDHSIYIFRFKL